ncbi:hypothetical protein F503_04927 [Ophiostoma piceae UAMH 11346]|uniref:CENP-V/GFA domain-containing protein n=1 Tax=Ophiostoma piceae (strain UAMH 11346) TaxID=1262450 RepID=S3BS03_OPHP1|nr:hypothetical protein F503_04927 [Ophiostoma piceae UAMH 11346]
MAILLSCTCLCGKSAQTVTARSSSGDVGPIPISICHCNTCRHTSGVFFTSYCPIQPPAYDGEQLSSYTSSPGTTRYFCKTCGCHVFRARQSSCTDEPLWEVATGTIVNEWRDDQDGDGPGRPVLEYTRHEHVADTVDGGLSGWLPAVSGRRMEGLSDVEPDVDPDLETETTDSSLDRTVEAACHCGSVTLRVRPPDHDLAASQQPHSGFSDLLVPFAASDPALVANPGDVKWWLRPSRHSSSQDTPPTRYLAGTCACQSCRLATGFEIQTWAFVPRVNILLSNGKPINFSSTGCPGIEHLSTYQSSPGVGRNFCSRCGATVFWHDTWRPDLIDVSAGLFRSGSGSRLVSLLDWCTSRVSFAEEAARGRRLLSAQRGISFVESLGTGMSSGMSSDMGVSVEGHA